MPAGDSPADSLHMIEQEDFRWLAVSVLFFVAAVGMTLGLPAVLTLTPNRGSTLGLLGVAVFLIGCLGTAGYAMLLAFFRALALSDAVRAEALDDVVADPGLSGYLFAWVAAFYVANCCSPSPCCARGRRRGGYRCFWSHTWPRCRWVP